MATEVKKKRGRPSKRLGAEKEAEKSEKEAAAKRAVDRQLQMDLELLRLTNKENPFRYTVNKRKDSWSLIAVDVTTLFEGEIFDDRRCRERVRILMKACRVEADKKVTGAGSLNLTEADTLLKSLIECEDFTANNANAEKKRSKVSS
ncbi:hypothetical protein RvY_08824 [Ramazzottius varieornatus]|uniref:MADF domain-containing protein n=1 Tax=Ramazzottius varieornatus TaxID=947166 RepID=A0A1D1V781_RAMVA|nr:hypothetical protein RvY_08824 [Ramazzottius varieornatus]